MRPPQGANTPPVAPTRGEVIGTCGHVLIEQGIAVEYHSETCDALEGYLPCIIYATYCAACTAELVLQPEFIRAERISSPDPLTVPRATPRG